MQRAERLVFQTSLSEFESRHPCLCGRSSDGQERLTVDQEVVGSTPTARMRSGMAKLAIAPDSDSGDSRFKSLSRSHADVAQAGRARG